MRLPFIHLICISIKRGYMSTTPYGSLVDVDALKKAICEASRGGQGEGMNERHGKYALYGKQE